MDGQAMFLALSQFYGYPSTKETVIVGVVTAAALVVIVFVTWIIRRWADD